MLKTLRTGAGLRVKELAERIGVAANTLGNAESGPHAVIGRKRVEAIAAALELDPRTADALLQAHAAAPPSAFALKRRERWAKVNAERKAARVGRKALAELEVQRVRVDVTENRHDRMMRALVRLLEGAVLEGAACTCADVYTCPLCQGMSALGLPRWSSPAEAGDALIALIPDESIEEGPPRAPDLRVLPGGADLEVAPVDDFG